ncbi:MAG: TonB family protein [Alistipes sp.]|nr:TonB family protein [Alistipes sp.]
MKQFIITSLILFATFAVSAAEQEPLYVVNNRVVSKESLNKINPNDIESMMVLKDDSAQQYVELGDTSNGVIIITLREEGEAKERLSAEVMPQFMGGNVETFRRWIMQNIRYPQEALEQGKEGTVIVKFTVGADGYINQNRLNFFDKCGAVFHDEVIRVLAKSPQWTPAREDGEAVAVTFTVPIVFAIPKENKIQESDAKLEVEKSIENIVVVGFDK